MNWIAIILIVLALVLWSVFYRIERKAHIRCHDEAVRLRRLLELEKEERESEKWTEVSSSYVVTESDLVRYKTPKEVYYNARKRIATNIGFDIVKHFQPKESLTESGNTKYTYTFKIRE